MLGSELVFDSIAAGTGWMAGRGMAGQDIEGDDLLRLRVEAELREQGLSVAIDPTSIGRIAALLGAEDGRKRERRLAVIQQQLVKMEVRWKPGVHQEF
jgi:hypothetical protein